MTRTTLSELIAADLLEPGDDVVTYTRAVRAHGTITADGQIKLANGETFKSASKAAYAATGKPVNGWLVWRVTRLDASLMDLRFALVNGTMPKKVRQRASSIGKEPDEDDAHARAVRVLDHIEALKAEHAAVRTWKANGEKGPKPLTPLLDIEHAKEHGQAS